MKHDKSEGTYDEDRMTPAQVLAEYEEAFEETKAGRIPVAPWGTRAKTLESFQESIDLLKKYVADGNRWPERYRSMGKVSLW